MMNKPRVQVNNYNYFKLKYTIFILKILKNVLGADVSDLSKAGIQVRTDNDVKSHMHHKFIIIDDYVLINGSFNWTRNAVNVNKENITVQQN